MKQLYDLGKNLVVGVSLVGLLACASDDPSCREGRIYKEGVGCVDEVVNTPVQSERDQLIAQICQIAYNCCEESNFVTGECIDFIKDKDKCSKEYLSQISLSALICWKDTIKCKYPSFQIGDKCNYL
ncbi:hypothetical protein HQ489_03960 [Candidatus Woesearchaeota archaeon]|nr:hypothetical protein [Candidatus Woesearchaeota archaeon]